MLVQALVEDYLDEYHVRVRIPKFHKLQGTANATPTDQLPLATICYQPGILPTYSLGDIVYVEFENDNPSYPVIMGKLLSSNTVDKSWSDIKTRSLIVDVDAKLSTNTTLGTMSYNDIDFSVSYILNQGQEILNQTELIESKADKSKAATITLSTSWTGTSSPYSQVVTVTGAIITADSKVDLLCTALLVEDLMDEGVLYLSVVNNNGVLTVSCVGNHPTSEYTIPCLVSLILT